VFKVVEWFIDWVVGAVEPTWWSKLIERIGDALWGAFISTVKGEWGKVMEAVGKLVAADHAVGAIIAAPSAFSDVSAGAGIPIGFNHPADRNRDGHPSASEMEGD
jgi:hypothetical protein